MVKRWTMTILILAAGSVCFAQEEKGDDELVSIAEKVKDMQEIEGFFNLYWDADDEHLYLEIEKWEAEFLYVASLPSNVEGSDRGSWSGGRVLRFERAGKKVFLVQSNYSFRATSDDPVERRAVREAYTESRIFGFKPAAETGDRVLVDATDFFMRDAMNVNKGSLAKDRSSFYWPRTRNFPKNTEVELTLTFSEGSGTTVRLHHSLIELPDDGYQMRRADARSGVGGISFLDYATPFTEPIQQRYATRHRLIKKNPSARVSEPLEPIVYYIDPGAPEPIRSALVEGASWWNEAFEAIGFRNAFQVKVLPADADPMDLRYNLVQWIHRPRRGWSSGGSVTDPRTGEIIAGRVYLGSQRVRQDFMIGSGLKALYAGDEPDSKEVEEMALARIRQLSAHEVGHTLGFGHNFAASAHGRTSVMDYPHPLIKLRDDGSIDFSDAYTDRIGEWDKVFVAYAYSHFAPGTDEDAALDKIIEDAAARGMFNLADVGAGSASPVTHQWDNGADALAELARTMRIRSLALEKFSEKNIPMGAELSSLEEVLVPVYLFHRYQIEAVSKSIGGVDYRLAHRGDGQTPVKIVDARTQRRALAALLGTIEPEALALPREVIKLIPPRSGRRWGEVFPRRTAPTFDPLATAETLANHSVSLLLNPQRAARLLANRSLDDSAPTLGEVLDALLEHTWKTAPPADPYLAELHRVADNVALYHLMALAANATASTQVRAVANDRIEELMRWLTRDKDARFDRDHEAHHRFAVAQIKAFQEDPSRFVVTQPSVAPPGPPIGMGEVSLPGMINYWDDWNN